VPKEQNTEKEKGRTTTTTSSAKSSMRIHCNEFHDVVTKNSKRKDSDYGGSG
jgi:hypothetical protein